MKTKKSSQPEMLDVDALRRQAPAWYYKRFNLTNKAIDYFLIPIEYGFTYLLRGIRTKWSTWLANGTPAKQELLIKFIQSVADRTLQNEEYPARLISTPAEAGPVVAGVAPDPVDGTAFNVNFSATPVKNNLILNYYYQRRETLNLPLRFEITNNVVGTGYVDILFIGYIMPDKDLPEWG